MKKKISFRGAFLVDYDKKMNCLIVHYKDGNKLYLDCSSMQK